MEKLDSKSLGTTEHDEGKKTRYASLSTYKVPDGLLTSLNIEFDGCILTSHQCSLVKYNHRVTMVTCTFN